MKLQKHKSPANRKGTLIGAILFFITGAAMIVYAVVTKVSWEHFSANGVETIAVVSNVKVIPGEEDDSYDIRLKYEYNGESYEGKMHYSSGHIKVGDALKIMIDPKDPEKMMRDPGNVLILLIPGGIFAAVGAGLFFAYRRM